MNFERNRGNDVRAVPGRERAGRVRFRESAVVGPVAVLEGAGGVAEVALLGAQVLRWMPQDGAEVLFWPAAGEASGPAGDGEELHGGIPVCWPWFGRMGPAGGRIHGVARYRRFAVREAGEGAVVLELASDAATREVFPHDFRVSVGVSVTVAGLAVELEGRNEGREAFAVTAGFHPYLRVSRADGGGVRVEGLDGAEYIDWSAGADGREVHGVQRGAWRPVPGSRVFAGARPVCRVRDAGAGRTVELAAEGHSRWCVWRAKAFGAGTRGRLAPEEREDFVCVEPVVFPRCDAVVLEPGGSHRMGLSLRVAAETEAEA